MSATERAPWLAAATQVIVDDVATPQLDDESLHHLSRVLRLRSGEVVCATDGAGGWVLCDFDGSASLIPSGDSGGEPAPDPALTVGFALVKASKPELVVQKLTELGVDHIVLFQARNSVARWDQAKIDRQIPRLRKISIEACAQSRRLHLPTVQFATLSDLAGRSSVLADAGGRSLRRADTVLLIGPEGGWDPSESAVAEAISLGPTILRAETAAIAGAAQMVALRAGLLTESE
ncbi:MAG TPA: RsmE family RNA methyltransferase [Microthrixaceae bacterium]|nr:RsmE family RNA methyltransferase [Microthrixaceae bacterium]